jgi:hypothetical protein
VRRSAFVERFLDARHLPNVHFDVGVDGLAGEVGFAALGITRQSAELFGELRRQPHGHGGCFGHVIVTLNSTRTL